VAGAIGAAALAPLAVASGTAGATFDPASDPYSMQAVVDNTGMTTFWDAGITGAGVDVAVIDTGVNPVPGLDTPGKVIDGPDLSLESQSADLAYLDTNGHGTFMAGLIAGKDADAVQPYSAAPSDDYLGVAPDARIVSLKVGVADGGVDVTQMIAAINWVVDNKNANGLNIRVLNLSFGTNSTQSYITDPLSHAAERAWHAGIVVVASAGNTGYQRGANAPGLADPAYNPYILAVGGYDTMGTASGSDDRVGAYSASANTRTARRPDVVAVGSRLQGLRVPNSWIDSTHPYGRLGERFFRGSGTSEAAAIASGTVALLLQKFPDATPDQIKRMLRSTARSLPYTLPASQGRGAIDYWRLAIETPWDAGTQTHTPANGTGSVELARGNDHISIDGVELRGEIDIFGMPFLPGTSGSSWSGGMWNGSTWSGSTWSGSTWSGSTWSGSTWSGSTWSGSTWSGSTWSGSTWSGSSWSGSSWSGSSWSGSTWSGGAWA
jgi:serine protease AprX